jgi:hypothetical protein
MHRFGRAGNPVTQLSEQLVDLGEIFVDGGNEVLHARIMREDDRRKLFRIAQEPGGVQAWTTVARSQPFRQLNAAEVS